MAINDSDIQNTITDDNAGDLCTCLHERAAHYDGTGRCGITCMCDQFAYSEWANYDARTGQ